MELLKCEHNSYTLSRFTLLIHVYNKHYDVLNLFYSMEMEFLKTSFSVYVAVIFVLKLLLQDPAMH